MKYQKERLREGLWTRSQLARMSFRRTKRRRLDV